MRGYARCYLTLSVYGCADRQEFAMSSATTQSRKT